MRKSSMVLNAVMAVVLSSCACAAIPSAAEAYGPVPVVEHARYYHGPEIRRGREPERRQWREARRDDYRGRGERGHDDFRYRDRWDRR